MNLEKVAKFFKRKGILCKIIGNDICKDSNENIFSFSKIISEKIPENNKFFLKVSFHKSQSFCQKIRIWNIMKYLKIECESDKRKNLAIDICSESILNRAKIKYHEKFSKIPKETIEKINLNYYIVKRIFKKYNIDINEIIIHNNVYILDSSVQGKYPQEQIHKIRKYISLIIDPNFITLNIHSFLTSIFQAKIIFKIIGRDDKNWICKKWFLGQEKSKKDFEYLIKNIVIENSKNHNEHDIEEKVDMPKMVFRSKKDFEYCN